MGQALVRWTSSAPEAQAWQAARVQRLRLVVFRGTRHQAKLRDLQLDPVRQTKPTRAESAVRGTLTQGSRSVQALRAARELCPGLVVHPLLCRRPCRKSEQVLRLVHLHPCRPIRPIHQEKSKAPLPLRANIAALQGLQRQGLQRQGLRAAQGAMVRPATQDRLQVKADKVSQVAILPERWQDQLSRPASPVQRQAARRPAAASTDKKEVEPRNREPKAALRQQGQAAVAREMAAGHRTMRRASRPCKRIRRRNGLLLRCEWPD
jgi:hypothetical protein